MRLINLYLRAITSPTYYFTLALINLILFAIHPLLLTAALFVVLGLVGVVWLTIRRQLDNEKRTKPR